MTNQEILDIFESAVSKPLDYAKKWKADNDRPVVGVLPMNFPAELVHASGALPALLQEDDEPVTVGQSRIFNFYCGYNRSLVNQTMNDDYKFLDAIVLGDHCVQILGTADVMRNHMPDVPILYDQLVSTIEAPWAFSESRRVLNFLKGQLEDVVGVEITDDKLKASIDVFNKSRQLLRQLYELRREGKLSLSSVDILKIVQSSMVMDREEHTRLLESLMENLKKEPVDYGDRIPVYLSGHMCHAPKVELLQLIEESGAVVVADDLYTGYRYISTDVEPEEDPLDSLTNWYLNRNKRVPCPTRSARQYDWDSFLVDTYANSGAQGVIVLMVKFCEPHMYFYPDIKDRFDKEGIPHLLLETEHEEMPLETLKTRLETFLEVAHRKAMLS